MAGPAYKAYTIREFEKDGKKESFWREIGAVFEHKDGKGLDVVLDALPVNGRISLREPSTAPKTAE